MSGSIEYDGKMTLLPANGARAYPRSFVPCRVTYKAGPNDPAQRPKNIEVTLALTGAFMADTATYKSGEPFMLVQDPGDQNLYSGTFTGNISSRGGGDPGYTIVLDGLSSGMHAVSWPLAALPVKVVVEGDINCLPVNQTDYKAPTDSDASKVTLIAKVTDPNSQDAHGDALPVENYTIYWQSTINNNAFGSPNDQGKSAEVRAFVNGETEVSGAIARDVTQQYGAIFSQTLKNGCATLELVTTTHPLCLGVNVLYASGLSVELDYVAIFDPDPDIAQLLLPKVNVGRTFDDEYNLDSVEGNQIALDLRLEALNGSTYQFFVFNNYDVKSANHFPISTIIKNFQPDSLNREIQVLLQKAVLESKAKTGSDGINQLFYVANNELAGCLTSAVNSGVYTGEVGTFTPDFTITPRDLPLPDIPNAGLIINLNTIQRGLVVDVLIKPNGAWEKPAPGDTLVVTIYASGWEIGNTELTGNISPQTMIIPAPAASGGSLPTQMSTTFPPVLVTGYGPDTSGSNDTGTLYVEYYVVPDGYDDIPANRIYSRIKTYELNTVA